GGGTARSGGARPRTPFGAALREARSPRSCAARSGRLASDRLEVDLLERRAEQPDAVDSLAVRDEAGDELRDLVPARRLVGADAVLRLDLDAARPRQLRGRPGGDDAPVEQD